MVSKFLDSITIALHKKFGDDYAFYVEEVEQNLPKPFFTIGTLSPSVRAMSAHKYFRVMPIVIHFFTEKLNTKDATKDNYSVAERVHEALEYLPVDNALFRGENIEWQIVDGTLQFFVTYRFYTTVEQERIYMEGGTFNGVRM